MREVELAEIEVEITQQDIDCSVLRSPCGCAFSKACARKWPKSYVVTTYTAVCLTRDTKNEEAKFYALPPEMLVWLENYDNGKCTGPATFKLKEKKHATVRS